MSKTGARNDCWIRKDEKEQVGVCGGSGSGEGVGGSIYHLMRCEGGAGVGVAFQAQHEIMAADKIWESPLDKRTSVVIMFTLYVLELINHQQAFLLDN